MADRRYLHQIPEVGMDLPESAAYIEKRLAEMGDPVPPLRRDGGECTAEVHQDGIPRHGRSTGVVATIGSGSPCILLRADFDALPMEEINDLPFCSKRNASHMCGHDTHAPCCWVRPSCLRTMSELKGTVKLMFQPGEEMGYGSKTMIDDGLLENPKVDAAMAIHIFSTTPVGQVTYCTGVASSSLDTFAIHIQGKGGHSSTPTCV